VRTTKRSVYNFGFLIGKVYGETVEKPFFKSSSYPVDQVFLKASDLFFISAVLLLFGG